MPNANITATTRELWESTRVREVEYKMPLIAALIKRNRKRVAGTKIKRTLDYAYTDSVTQEYRPNEPLTSETMDFLTTAEFNWRYVQHPVKYGVEEFAMNRGADQATAPGGDLIRALVAKAQDSMRLKLYKMAFYPFDSDTDTASTVTRFQSVGDALAQYGDVATYGGLTRNATTMAWWNGASYDGTYADNNTARVMTIRNLRQCISALRRHNQNIMRQNLLIVMGSDLFGGLQDQIESHHQQTSPGMGLAEFGFNEIALDGVSIVEEPWFDTQPYGSSSGDDTQKWVCVFHVPDWEYRVYPGRDMAFTGFRWQGDIEGGKDEWLGRIMLLGNLVCWRPNSSMHQTNWSV